MKLISDSLFIVIVLGILVCLYLIIEIIIHWEEIDRFIGNLIIENFNRK
ncbi:MAG: hypothetical protein K0S01_2439 [Herbinix sp.]|jgi:hypothetical protein|nr:hypothetical protein [Herbinix sp.]